MRIALVGPRHRRAALRDALAGSSIEIAGEYDTVSSVTSRRGGGDFDAVLISGGDARGVEPPPVTSRAATIDNGDADEIIGEQLTARELDVLALLVEGFPNRTIAERLDISDQTVKFHVASILAKLGAANRTQAVRRAVQRGLITL